MKPGSERGLSATILLRKFFLISRTFRSLSSGIALRRTVLSTLRTISEKVSPKILLTEAFLGACSSTFLIETVLSASLAMGGHTHLVRAVNYLNAEVRFWRIRGRAQEERGFLPTNLPVLSAMFLSVSPFIFRSSNLARVFASS